jgi:hypothetical protein
MFSDLQPIHRLTMNNFFLIVVLLLVLMLLSLIFFYFFTQESLRDISKRLTLLQPPPSFHRNEAVIRRERAHHHDQLVLLEADISLNQRESLTLIELESIDAARKTIKSCIDELKTAGEWIGLPFDFEWTEILARLPNVNRLYRSSELPAAAPGTAPLVPGKN